MAASSTRNFTFQTGSLDIISGRLRLPLVTIIKAMSIAFDTVNNTHLKYFVAGSDGFCSRKTIKRYEPYS